MRLSDQIGCFSAAESGQRHGKKPPSNKGGRCATFPNETEAEDSEVNMDPRKIAIWLGVLGGLFILLIAIVKLGTCFQAHLDHCGTICRCF